MIKVQIPLIFRRFVGEQSEIEMDAGSVRDVMLELEAAVPAFKNKLLDENGEIRRFLAVFVNGDNIINKQGAETKLEAGYEVALVPAAGGG